MAQTRTAVEVRNLRKDFGEGNVLDGIDLDVPASEITLLMGPNGVGKTILLSCLAGGLHADAGRARVFGDPPQQAREHLSFMLQDAMLVEELTGTENIAFFRDLHPRSTGDVEPILETLDFEMSALDREVGDYSGGMRRKLELAISLSVDVSLHLLDEPTAALDMTTVENLHSLLAARRDAGETIVMTSHLPTDADLADRIAFVTGEGIAVAGTPEALREQVPPVVSVEPPGEIAGLVRDGQLFQDEVYTRGFLRNGVDPEAVESSGEGPTPQVREPTYTDMFNYYVNFGGSYDE